MYDAGGAVIPNPFADIHNQSVPDMLQGTLINLQSIVERAMQGKVCSEAYLLLTLCPS